MRKLLNKIFSGKLGIGKFMISSIAFVLGLTLVLISVQAYFKIDNFLNPKKNFSGYLILNKEVGLGNTIFGAKADFTKKDIEDLKTQEFVEDLGMFKTSNFRVVLDLSGKMGLPQGMYMDLAFESIPDRFVDEKPFNFRWSPDAEVLPIIVSQDFLNLYNFSFSQRMGTPQLSKSTIGLIPFNIEVSGAGGKRVFSGKVVGFSERIPSVLVPEEFIDWSNENIGHSNVESLSRVIIKARGDKGSQMTNYLDYHGIKVGADKLQLSKISGLVIIVMSILFVIGAAFIIFALVIVVMNFSLIIAEAKEEIKLLFQLGYKMKYILQHLVFYLIFFLVAVTGISLAGFLFVNNYFISFLTKNGVSVTSDIEGQVYVAGILFIIISSIISFVSIFRVLKKNL